VDDGHLAPASGDIAQYDASRGAHDILHSTDGARSSCSGPTHAGDAIADHFQLRGYPVRPRDMPGDASGFAE
jgi:hypothetical protein